MRGLKREAAQMRKEADENTTTSTGKKRKAISQYTLPQLHPANDCV